MFIIKCVAILLTLFPSLGNGKPHSVFINGSYTVYPGQPWYFQVHLMMIQANEWMKEVLCHMCPHIG